MCGIAGIIAYRDEAPPVDPAELAAIRDHMAKRGPDGEGLWMESGGRAGLAHRRLAIIDLSHEAAQPMSLRERSLQIVFNGEIYNYPELREGLAARGLPCRTHSDTEVLLQLYAERGAAMVDALRGMYAFAIWDEREKTLFLARDPFGIKPLYYADDGGTLRFASQVKALRAGGAIPGAPDAAGHVGFFVTGSVPEPFTLFAGISSLPAGHTLTLARGHAPQVRKFFDVTEELALGAQGRQPLSIDARQELLRTQLARTVDRHMVADVPVGLFLSAGIDSSVVCAFAAGSGRLRSVTLGFEEYRGTRNDEVPLAAKTAAALGTIHQVSWLERGAFEESLEDLLDAMDQPSIDGVNTYFVSKAAAACGMKVALSGLGGDELFGGYPSFRQVPRLARVLRGASRRRWMGVLARRFSAPLIGHVASPKYASLLEFGGTLAGSYLLRRALYLPWELRRFMDPSMVEEGLERLGLVERLEHTIRGLASERQKVAALEMSWYMRNQLLRDADWAGMAHSLEIRVPLVDVDLLRAMAPLIASENAPGKRDAARAVPVTLPEELQYRPKTGFSIPVQEWARRSNLAGGHERRLRSWSHVVYQPYKRLRVLALLSDGYGGHGGIALYNRDFLSSLCAMEQVAQVVALPRLVSRPLEPLPEKLEYVLRAATGKLEYVRTCVAVLRGDRRFDLVVCCHVNLLPLALVAKRIVRAPLIMFIYGIDAWTPQPAPKAAALRWVDRFVSISDVTRRKFTEWSNVDARRITILPNAIHPDWYGAGERDAGLVRHHGLEGKVVLMTLGRLVSSERYKGFDEVLEALPALLGEMPNLVYMIVGDGTDRGRLEAKARALGVHEHVRFTGMVPEARKADHYRLADAYVMPSRGEGFGFVLLEAMACGVPAVASLADGGREAVRDSELGILVDPDDPEDVKRGIRLALERGRGAPPKGLEYFHFDNFRARAQDLVAAAVRPASRVRQAA